MPKKQSTQPEQDYQALNAELDAVLSQLQASDVAVDDAVLLYERGLEIIAQLEKRVRTAENSIERLAFDMASMEQGIPQKAARAPRATQASNRTEMSE